METVVIVIHLMVIIALVAIVLMQRSEGGALGIGGGGGGNFMSSRGQGNVLTRATAILAAAFFATSIALTILARMQERPSSILDTVPTVTTPAGESSGEGILDELQGIGQPPPPADDAAAPPATTPEAAAPPAATTTPTVPSGQ